ncbi:MAG TPA: ABC transporter permease [Limnochordales bacterium]
MTEPRMQQSGGAATGTSLARRRLRVFLRNRAAVAGAIIILIVVVVAIAAPWLAPHDPVRQSAVNRLKPPGTESYLLGTDRFGRDTLSRVIWGARISLQVGVASVLLGMVIGVPVGIVAGYKGGRTDQILMRLVDVALAFPTLVLGLIIVALLGSGLWKLILAIALVNAPQFARVARGPTIALRDAEFVQAARALGASDWRIMFQHVLPNILPDVLTVSSLWVASAIRTEANLSFLGLGVPPPTPSWGNMVRDGIDFLGRAPWLAIAPAAAIFITILAFNMLGDGLRDIADPRTHGQ